MTKVRNVKELSLETAHLLELERLRQRKVLVFENSITDEGVEVVYEYLRRQTQPLPALDLVLTTSGGSVIAARRLALLLREYTQYLTIFVPRRATSAGTLLCLSANEIVMTAFSELSPIDPHISAANENVMANGPDVISAEDIRLFPKMAEDWFQVTAEGDRLQVLALVAQRIFPSTLTSFYRSRQLTHLIAEELLDYQLPNIPKAKRGSIAENLIGGFFGHEYTIFRKEAINLGLHVRNANPNEEQIVWDLYKSVSQHLAVDRRDSNDREVGIVVGNSFVAINKIVWSGTPMPTDDIGQAGDNILQSQFEWQIEFRGDAYGK